MEVTKAHLQQPHAPVLVQHQVEAEQLEGVGEREEGQLAADSLQALACIKTINNQSLQSAARSQRP